MKRISTLCCPWLYARGITTFVLQNKFENLISDYILDDVGKVDHFLSEILSQNLRNNLMVLLDQKQLASAGIGNQSHLTKDMLIRSDMIYWLDRLHKDEHEDSFFDMMDAFVIYLNRSCYTGITSYEFHYAYYDTGSFYKRHLDQFKDDNKRAFSMIFYLNENWQPSDGGQLSLYHKDSVEMVAPTDRKCVFFNSSMLEHEVMLNHKPRMSITGWLKTN